METCSKVSIPPGKTPMDIREIMTSAKSYSSGVKQSHYCISGKINQFRDKYENVCLNGKIMHTLRDPEGPLTFGP